MKISLYIHNSGQTYAFKYEKKKEQQHVCLNLAHSAKLADQREKNETKYYNEQKIK